MYEPLLENLGLAKNEAKVYETLLLEGESPVGHIANKSKVHRRNVYDTLQRLLEKGLVFEILQKHENHYQAVDPKKLSEILQEKQDILTRALPTLEKMFADKPNTEAVYIYKGLEGWKNYMRDILRVSQDDYIFGAKGAWHDPKIKSFAEQFAKQALNQGIKFHVLFDEESRDRIAGVAEMLQCEYRFIPKEFFALSACEIFGDHVVFLTDNSEGLMREDYSLTVVINQKLADSFRAWFKLMWSASKEL